MKYIYESDTNEFATAPDDLGEVAVVDPLPPPAPPTSETVLQRVLKELLDLPKEQQQKLYRFLYDCDCRINE